MTEPTSLRGYMDEVGSGVAGYGAAVDYLLENVPSLVHPQSVYTYARMRHDPMITGILAAYSGPIERAHWSLDPAGCRDEVVMQIADDLGLPIKGWSDEPNEKEPDLKVQLPTGARRRNFTWADHLRIAGLDRVYGHMFFEQAWAEQGGGWRLNVVQERMPQTVDALKLNKDGTLASVQQGAIVGSGVGGAGIIDITTADSRLVYYTRAREGSNYFGQSLIRPCYGPWLIKDQIQRVHATSIRKFGMGIPEVTAPDSTPQSIALAQRYAQSIAAGERSGAGLPPGFKTTWQGMTGSVPDAMAFLTYLNQEMARATLTMLLTMAGAERGNRSLGETVMDLLIMSQQADAEFHANEGTRQIVIPLVTANWGEDEPAPQINVGNVGEDIETTAQDIYWMLAYGGIKPDAPFRSWLRETRNMPPEDPDDPIFQVPAAVPPPQPDPNAPPPPTPAEPATEEP